VGNHLVTAFSDQSDAFHEAGDTGMSYASADGVSWSAVANTYSPFLLNGVVPDATDPSSALGFTYMLKGQPRCTGLPVCTGLRSAYIQSYQLKSSAAGVEQVSASNVTLAFPAAHALAPHGAAPNHQSNTSFGMVVTGMTIKLKSGGWLATMYGYYLTSSGYSLVAVKSMDGGNTWKWLSTVASHEDPTSPAVCKQPSESSTVYLKNGSLFTVMRSGGSGSPLCQVYSHDDGHTWSTPTVMPGPIGVEPKLRVLKSGRLVLTTGRPGIFLYVANDPPTSWSKFNIAAAHNQLVKDKTLKFAGDIPGGGINGTTSYTGLAVSRTTGDSDAVHVTYDRLGAGWGTIGKGQVSAVFCMKLEIPASV
jgi:hypothetical protein